MALADIPNDGPPDWEAWNRVAMAVWAATGGEEMGWVALDAWSRRNPAYDPNETRQRWDHYRRSPPTKIGAGTLFYMAAEARRRAREPEPEPQLEPPVWPELDEAPHPNDNPHGIWNAGKSRLRSHSAPRMAARHYLLPTVPIVPSGHRRRRRDSDHHNAKDRAAWRVVTKHVAGKSEEQAKEVIKTWIKNSILISKDYHDPARHEDIKGLFLHRLPQSPAQAPRRRKQIASCYPRAAIDNMSFAAVFAGPTGQAR